MAGKIGPAQGTVIIVPARLASTRLPRKPLVDIAGRPLIVRVMDGLEGASADLTVVATDSTEIADAVSDAGYTAILTGPAGCGTERVFMAWEELGRPGSRIINVQGDEPSVKPWWISDLLQRPPEPDLVVTLARPGTAGEEDSPDSVKVFLSGVSGEVVGFSRNHAQTEENLFLVHVGLYCFSPGSLEACISCGTTPESRSESLEQLAWLQNGIRIGVVTGDYRGHGVDTPDDLARAREVFGRGK